MGVMISITEAAWLLNCEMAAWLLDCGMPARMERLSNGVGCRYPATTRSVSLIAVSIR